MSSKSSLRNHSRFGIIAATLFIALVSLYFARGWIRGPVASSVVGHLYAHQIDNVFDQKIKPVNALLKPLGITPKASDPDNTDRTICFDGNFHIVQETVICGRWATSYRELIPSRVKESWPQESVRIAKLLKDKGWKIDGRYLENSSESSSTDKLNMLFDDSKPQVSVPYTLKVNGVLCDLEFRYDPMYQDIPAELTVDESCTRDVNIFGGY